MIVIYSPAGVEEARYDADLLTCGEWEVIERTTEMECAAIGMALRRQSPRAMRAVAWALRKRGEPTLRYTAFDPMRTELKARLTTAEVPEVYEEIARAHFSPEETEQAEAEIILLAADPDAARLALAEAKAPKEADVSAAPAPSLSDGSSTPEFSPTS